MLGVFYLGELKIMSQIIRQIKKLYKNTRQLISHCHLRKIEIAVLAVILVEFLFPQVSLAQQLEEEFHYQGPTIMQEERLLNNDPDFKSEPTFNNSLPQADNKQPKRVIWITVTAYSSTVDQCDGNPCITANGFNLCQHNKEDVVAANFLPFGKMIKMPDYFGEQVFTVQDRMNARYYYRLDVWMKTREAAKQFGVKKLKVEVY